jgi:AbrB family looped-hinge helix DNA binding protein
MAIVKVSEKGWIVIPKELRKKYGIKPGGRVNLMEWDGSIVLVAVPDDPVGALYGMLAGPGPSALDELLRERALDREREEAKIAHWADREGDSE